MSEQEDNALYFKGILQVEVAFKALAFTGINPTMENALKWALDLYESLETGEDREDFEMGLPGEPNGSFRADVLNSLGQLAASEFTTGDLRVAAEALREIL